MSFIKKIYFEKNNSIMQYNGKNGDGRDFFSYIVCDSTGYNKITEDFKVSKKTSNLKEYGEVIYIDFLKEPDDKAKKFLENYLKQNNK